MKAREIAFDVLRRVEEGGAFASRALDAALASAGAIDPREAGLATQLVYGSLRRALTLDAALAPHSSRPIAQADPAARIALRLGAYQLLYLSTAPHAAVGETVALVKAVNHGRAAGYVNAVLRALARDPRPPAPPPREADPVGHVAAAEALPRWLAEEWVAWLGADEALALAAAMNEAAPLCLRSPTRDRLLERLAAAGVEARPTEGSPHGVLVSGSSVAAIARAAGDVPFQVQDEGAQLVSIFALEGVTAKGARVLDACAAPGGKAFHLAEMVGPTGEVVAIELHPRKAEELRREAVRRGLPNVRVICADAAKPIPGLEPASFDAVLVDAPCAGLGTLRRHPELKLRRRPEDLPRLAAIQRDILASCARYAKPRAPVTYAICSLSRAEGPEVVAAILGDARGKVTELLTLPHRGGADGFYAARAAR